MSYAVESITSSKGEVVIRVREWDGIDHPDYIALDGLSPGQALGWATQLVEEAKKSSKWIKDNDEGLRKKLSSDRDKLSEQIEELDKKIAAKEQSNPLLSQEEAFQRAVKAGLFAGLVSKPEDAA